MVCSNISNSALGLELFLAIWFVKNNIPCDLYYLKNKMVQTGHMDLSEMLTKEKFVEFVSRKIKEIDFDLAKSDVEPFFKKFRPKR